MLLETVAVKVLIQEDAWFDDDGDITLRTPQPTNEPTNQPTNRPTDQPTRKATRVCRVV
jgi:hypothetical protein